jgi:hypothetical protein
MCCTSCKHLGCCTGRTRQVSCHTAVLVVQVLCAWYKNVVPGVLEDWRLRSHQTGAPSSETPSCMNSVMFASFVLIAMTHLDYDTKTEMIFTGSARELFPIAWSYIWLSQMSSSNCKINHSPGTRYKYVIPVLAPGLIHQCTVRGVLRVWRVGMSYAYTVQV